MESLHPEGRSTYMEGLHPEGRSAYREGLHPEGRSTYMEGLHPEGRSTYMEGLHPEGRSAYREGLHPEGRSAYTYGGSASRGEVCLQGGSASRGEVCIQGDQHQGVTSGSGRASPPPPELEKWAVSILLEWFLGAHIFYGTNTLQNLETFGYGQMSNVQEVWMKFKSFFFSYIFLDLCSLKTWIQMFFSAFQRT